MNTTYRLMTIKIPRIYSQLSRDIRAKEISVVEYGAVFLVPLIWGSLMQNEGAVKTGYESYTRQARARAWISHKLGRLR